MVSRVVSQNITSVVTSIIALPAMDQIKKNVKIRYTLHNSSNLTFHFIKF